MDLQHISFYWYIVLYYSLHASIHLDGGAVDAHSDNFTDICCDTVKKRPYIKKKYKTAQQFLSKLPAVSSLYYWITDELDEWMNGN